MLFMLSVLAFFALVALRAFINAYNELRRLISIFFSYISISRFSSALYS